jgi:hypothetical protein
VLRHCSVKWRLQMLAAEPSLSCTIIICFFLAGSHVHNRENVRASTFAPNATDLDAHWTYPMSLSLCNTRSFKQKFTTQEARHSSYYSWGFLLYTILPNGNMVILSFFFQFFTIGKNGNLVDIYYLEKNPLPNLHKNTWSIYYNNIILYISDNTHILLIPPMNTTRTTIKKLVVPNKSQPSDPYI